MTIEKLLKCLELTRSDSDGEALNAVRKANTIRNTLGKSWDDLLHAAPPRYEPARQEDFDFSGYPDIEDMLAFLEGCDLPERAGEFVLGLREFYDARGYLTDKQHAALCRTYGGRARTGAAA